MFECAVLPGWQVRMPRQPIPFEITFTPLGMPPFPAPQVFPWFTIRVKSRCEHVVSEGLRARGIEEFPAFYRARRRWSDRFKEVELPLFPGYVFARFDPDRRFPILSTHGVVMIVSASSKPIPVPEEEIAAVRAIIASGLPAIPCPFLRTGQRILIRRGPLAGVEGIVTAIKKQYRLVVSVTLLQRSVAVEIDREWITLP